MIAPSASAGADVRIRVAEYAVADAGVLSTIGLGSCVAIALYDPQAHVGGLAHILLPHPSAARDASNPAKFPETVVPLMVGAMTRLGASRARIRAKIVGGAAMFANLATSEGENVGDRNVEATRMVLDAAGIIVEAQDTGGDYGRSVFLRIDDGRVEVRSTRAGTRVL
jgi:chemotaxis protein CheD